MASRSYSAIPSEEQQAEPTSALSEESLDLEPDSSPNQPSVSFRQSSSGAGVTDRPGMMKPFSELAISAEIQRSPSNSFTSYAEAVGISQLPTADTFMPKAAKDTSSSTVSLNSLATKTDSNASDLNTAGLDGSSTALEDERAKRRKQRQILSRIFRPSQLFEFMVVVSLELQDNPDPRERSPGKRLLIPKISYRFPPTSSSADGATDEDLSEDARALLRNIPTFCFPEWGSATTEGRGSNAASMTVDDYLNDSKFALNATNQTETFSFVLTDMDRKKRFGYCRRVMSSAFIEGDVAVTIPITSGRAAASKTLSIPTNSSPTKSPLSELNPTVHGIPVMTTTIRKRKALPEVYCIVSSIGCFSLFSQILDIVEQRRKSAASGQTAWGAVFSFLKAVIAQKVPRPGKSLMVKAFLTQSSDAAGATENLQEYTLHRPNEYFSYAHVSYLPLFQSLHLNGPSALSPQSSSFHLLVTLLTGMLLERRIILISSSLSNLSASTSALLAMLYPLEWPFVFIPILPANLLGFLMSPTPYLCGMLVKDAGKVIEGWRREGGVFVVSRKPTALPPADLPSTRPQQPSSQSSTAGAPSPTQRRSAQIAAEHGARKNSSGSSRSSASPVQEEPEEVLPLEEVMVLNLDSGTVMRHDTAEQDRNAMPTYLRVRLKQLLEEAMTDNIRSNTSENVDLQNALIAEAMLKFFMILVGPYREFMRVEVEQVTGDEVEDQCKICSSDNISTHPQNNSGSRDKIALPPSGANLSQHKRAVTGPEKFSHHQEPDSRGTAMRVKSADSLNSKNIERKRVLVRFDSNAFVDHHPLVTGDPNSIIYLSRSRFSPSKSSQVPLGGFEEMTGPGGNINPGNTAAPMIPSQAQRKALHAFLKQFVTTQAFHYFIQEREEAFQYHYQSQLDTSSGLASSTTGLDGLDDQSTKNAAIVDSGLKHYFVLAQSRFEKTITHLETRTKQST